MGSTRDERIGTIVARMQGVFDVKWDAGVSAGDAFEQARAALIRSLETDLQLAREVTFQRFADSRLPRDVRADTIMEPPHA